MCNEVDEISIEKMVGGVAENVICISNLLDVTRYSSIEVFMVTGYIIWFVRNLFKCVKGNNDSLIMDVN